MQTLWQPKNPEFQFDEPAELDEPDPDEGSDLLAQYPERERYPPEEYE